MNTDIQLQIDGLLCFLNKTLSELNADKLEALQNNADPSKLIVKIPQAWLLGMRLEFSNVERVKVEQESKDEVKDA